MRLLEDEGTTGVADGAHHPDLNMWEDEIPKGSLDTKNENYWWYHHTHGENLLLYKLSVLYCNSIF